jgi:hypothetical protein
MLFEDRDGLNRNAGNAALIDQVDGMSDFELMEKSI